MTYIVLILSVRSRWDISWKWADSGLLTQGIGAVTRATVSRARPAATRNHSAAYFRKLAAALKRKAMRIAALRAAARKNRGRKFI